MDSSRKTAIIVGVLFIVATVTAVISGLLVGNMIQAPDYLVNLAANANSVTIAMLLEGICAVSVVGIGFMMFPILKKQAEGLALGYAGVRIIEAVMLIVGAISLLSLLTLGQESMAGALGASQASGTLFLALRDWSHVVGTFILLGVGGLFLNALLYKSKLVPRFLSVWGIIGGVMILITGILCMFGLSPNSQTASMLAIPIAVQEMVFAVWLIAKGFNSPALASLAAKNSA